MFYPQAMTEIELIVPARDLLAVTKVLSSEGVFQQADSSYLGLDQHNTKGDTAWHERAAAYASLERRIQTIMQTLGVDEGYPQNTKFEEMADLKTDLPTVERIEGEVKRVSDQLASEHKHIEQLTNTQHQLEPVAGIDIDVSAIRSPQYLFSELGTMPNTNIDRLQTSLNRIPHVFLVLRQEAQNSVVWLVGGKQSADILARAARSAYINPANLPEDYHGTPSEIIAALRNNVEEARRHITELEGEMDRLCQTYQQQLNALLWSVRTSRMLADAIVRFGKLQYTYLIVGWVPSSGLADLLQRLKQVSKETLIEANPLRRDRADGQVPVKLHNPRFMKPFQTLVTTYAHPSYNEIDPTFLIALTFPLLFGAMFGDAGQGLVLAAAGWLIMSGKVKALKSLSALGGLIAVCGLFATVFGFLYGSFFGFEHVIPALWLHPLENIMQILIIAIGAGVVLLIAGFVIGIFNAWLARDWGRFFFDRNGLAGLLLYVSLLLIVVETFTHSTLVPIPLFLVIAAIGGVAIMFSEPLKRLVEGHRPLLVEGVGTFAIQAFFELFETLISFLSNTLSYVRVGAFAVAHAGLSQVFFILAELVSPGHGIGYWLMIIFGNIFIVGFEGLIVGIQTMRLEYYEFFSKFFKGGGSTYEPLTLRPDINEQV